MRTIPLRNIEGQEVATAFVDDDDFERLDRHHWSLLAGKARRGVVVGGRLRTLFMHRDVMGAGFGDGLAVRHINGNKLDNRKTNLRVRPVVTPAPHPYARTPITAGALDDTPGAE